MADAKKRIAIVTGANKGIGFEICRQLASNGILVVLTARDENRGIAAAEKLKESGLEGHVIFHVLDVTKPDTVTSLADFIKNQFGKLDILVNNAGIGGTNIDVDAFNALDFSKNITNWDGIMTETCELAEDCVNINYYGAKRMVEAFLPLLQLSDSPTVVNVSSAMGKLKNVSNEWAKGVLEDIEQLTEEKIDEVLNEMLKDFKEGSLKSKEWPRMAAYTLSKAALTAYTRILAKKHLSFCINCVCPGFVKTDINYNKGFLTVEEGAESVVRLALLPTGSPSGLFYIRNEVSPF